MKSQKFDIYNLTQKAAMDFEQNLSDYVFSSV